jgi:DNA-binding NarL/FixJ family response regulator
MAAPQEVDIALPDIPMPGSSGMEVLEILTKRHQCPQVTMATSVLDRSIIEEAMNLGTCGYVPEYFNMADLSDRS